MGKRASLQPGDYRAGRQRTESIGFPTPFIVATLRRKSTAYLEKVKGGRVSEAGGRSFQMECPTGCNLRFTHVMDLPRRGVCWPSLGSPYSSAWRLA